MSGRRVLVCGGRDYNDEARVFRVLDLAHAANPIGVIIEGEAPGADTLGREWAKSRGIPFEAYPAAWDDLTHADALIRTRADGKKYDARAGFRRNQKMVDVGAPDVVAAFPGGTGTDDMIRRAEAAHIKVVKVKR